MNVCFFMPGFIKHTYYETERERAAGSKTLKAFRYE